MKVKLKDLMQEGFRIAGDHPEKNILAIPIRLTDEMTGAVMVIIEDAATLDILKTALQTTPPATTLSPYKLRFSVYDGVSDRRIVSDKDFGFDMLLGVLNVVGAGNVTLKWDTGKAGG